MEGQNQTTSEINISAINATTLREIKAKSPESNSSANTKPSLKKVVVIVIFILAVIAAAVGIYFWIKNQPVEGEAIIMKTRENLTEEDNNIIDERNLIVKEVNAVAYENEALSYDKNGKPVYNYPQIEQNLNNYLNNLSTETGKTARTCFSAETLSIIGDLSGAESLLAIINEESLTKSEQYHCYIALISYHRERGNADETEKYWNLLKETDLYTSISTRNNK